MLITPEKFSTYSIRNFPWGDNICQVLSAAIHAADAGLLVEENLYIDSSRLVVQGTAYHLGDFERIFIIGAGKAALPMAESVTHLLVGQIISCFVITKDGYTSRSRSGPNTHITVAEAAHPIPDQRTIDATSSMLSLVGKLHPNDLVICLISGGGSSLLSRPAMGLSLGDLQITSSLLLSSGANIGELNIVRKHLDDIKGGGLARLLHPAAVISLILSDVIGDRLDSIASGPTSADPSTYRDAWQILSKYQLLDQVPASVRSHLSAGVAAEIPETVKPGSSFLNNVHNYIIGNNSLAVAASVSAARSSGFNAQSLPFTLDGEASSMGNNIVNWIKSVADMFQTGSRPVCFIAGGETTVTVRGNGTGGRNQELALASVESLSSIEPVLLVSLATDGGDGTTDAAGAVATGQTLSRGCGIGLNPARFLENNDSYNYFNQLGDLIKIGPTLTNVNDLLFIFKG